MNAGTLCWTAETADWVIPGPWKGQRCFDFDLKTGEAITHDTYAVGGDLLLSQDDLTNYWEEVEAADLKEMQDFVKHGVFRLRPRKTAGSNCIDAVWVRRWKWDVMLQAWIIKSRLCGRGFLDKQRFDVQKHSNTASRLSQRLLCSLAVQHDLEIESWDIATAFLQCLNFKDLYKKGQGVQARGA